MLEAMYRVCGCQLGPGFEVQTAIGKIYFYLTVKEMQVFCFFFLQFFRSLETILRLQLIVHIHKLKYPVK